ncbi:wd repeat-containing protein 23, partial [Lasius niger]
MFNLSANVTENRENESEDEHPAVSRADFIPDTTRLVHNDISSIIGEASGIVHNSDQENMSIIPVIQRRNLRREDFSPSEICRLRNSFLPNNPHMLKKYDSKVYCGIYSKDGRYFINATQDKQLHVFSTHNGGFEPYTGIQARDVGWSILDVAISPDNGYIAYSSWSESLYQCPLLREENASSNAMETLQLAPTERRFCVFSIAFSHDGREILCGANDNCLYIYDRERNQKVLEFRGHSKDVNAIIFADDTSQVFFSGSDDGLCKVWDKRTNIDKLNPRAVGMFAGHRSGITYIDSRGDQRYLISNSKDQCIKLWDMRRYSNRTVKQLPDWDYRWMRLNLNEREWNSLLEGDTSVMTYYGHSVRKSLIRCRFSPKVTTGQRYIYTGDARGRLIIYDLLTGRIVHNVRGHKGCVRDVNWHPSGHNILTSS